MQTESISAAEEFAARHIKVVLKSGYDNFSAVYRISASGATNLFTTKVDTNFSFGSNTTAPSKFSSNEAEAPKTQPRQKIRLDDEQQAYSFNTNPAPQTALSSALSDGANPDETEEAGFQSTFRLPNDPTFGKRKQDSVATEDGSGGDEEDDDDDDAFVGVGGGVNWQL